MISIEKLRSIKPPTITGPIADPKTVKAETKLLIEPKCYTPYNSAIRTGGMVYPKPDPNPISII